MALFIIKNANFCISDKVGFVHKNRKGDNRMKFHVWIFSVSMMATNCVNAQSTTSPIDMPKLVAGERWEYQTSPRRINECNPDRPYKTTITVQSVDDNGVTIKAGNREIRLNSRLAELQDVNGTSNVMELFNFPMVAGKTWERRRLTKMSSGGALKTDLSCEHMPMEKVTVPAGEFEAIRILCKGQWNNLAAGTSDKATYTDWYAPAVKNFVKQEVVTWYRGNYCADTETVLLKFTARP